MRGVRSPAIVLVLAVGVLVAGCSSSTSTATAPTAPAPPARATATTTTTTTTTTIAVPATVRRDERTFTDTSRTTPHDGQPPAPGRTLVTKLWLPSTPGPRPLVVLAHGIGGDPDKFDQLATSWARAGFAVAAIRFPASSAGAGAGVNGVIDSVQQPADVSFVLDGLLADRSLALDADRIGVAGLSLGGSTVYALTTDTCCIDHRIKAAAILDGLRPDAFPGGRLVPNQVPVLMLHCDKDYLLPYDFHAVPGYARLVAPAWLVTMHCVQHAEPYEDTPSDRDAMVQAITLDFWRGTLEGRTGELARIEHEPTAAGHATYQHKG